MILILYTYSHCQRLKIITFITVIILDIAVVLVWVSIYIIQLSQSRKKSLNSVQGLGGIPKIFFAKWAWSFSFYFAPSLVR